MRAIKEGGLVADAAGFVRPKGGGDLAKVRLVGGKPKRVAQHPGQVYVKTKCKKKRILLLNKELIRYKDSPNLQTTRAFSAPW